MPNKDEINLEDLKPNRIQAVVVQAQTIRRGRTIFNAANGTSPSVVDIEWRDGRVWFELSDGYLITTTHPVELYIGPDKEGEVKEPWRELVNVPDGEDPDA